MQSEQLVANPASALDVRGRRRHRIEPARGVLSLDLPELWRFRELLYFLVWRDVKARYKQTFLGASWAVLRPFLSMVVFTVVFGHLAGIKPGSDVPYPLFLFTGLLAWTYFSSALTNGGASIVGNGNLVTKAYFPRLYIPLAAIVAPLVDLALSFLVLAGMFAWYGRAPSWHVVSIPLFLGLGVLGGLGVALSVSALTVRYRDVPYALPFAVQLWMYMTPVIYPVTLVPGQWRWLISLNPMTGVVDGFRWSLLGGQAPSASTLAASASIAFVLAVAGLIHFRRSERRFADLI